MATKLLVVVLLAALLNACGTPQSKTIMKPRSVTETTDQPSSTTMQTSNHRDEPGKTGPDKSSARRLSAKEKSAQALGLSDDEPKARDLWSTLSQTQVFARQTSHPRIQPYLIRYTNKQSYFDRFIERAPRYLPYVAAQLKEKQMPPELALLPFIESAYNPFAYSSSGAAGLWQFIPSTAKHLGLNSNWWYDGRRDVLTSTEAALRYLSYLHQRFSGDWLLALAAYNGGEGTVSRAISKNRSQGLPVDYWSLTLPRETSAYVPHFLAFAKIVSAPGDYGLRLSELSGQVDFRSIELNQQIDLQQAARLADIDTETLYQLNPGFLRWASPPSGPYNILLPTRAIATFNKQIADIPKADWLASQHHIVQLGDTLSQIAQRYHIPVATVVNANELKSTFIVDGQVLKIPVGARAITASARGKPPHASSNASNHRVNRGETLSGIAKQYAVSINDLVRWNQWPVTKTLRPGQNLIVSTAETQKRAGQKSIKYQVRKGDSLFRIAQQFKVAVSEILVWNALKIKAPLFPGQKLVLYPRS